tara:strand:- start:122 stop:472 length:351 start_codon:yes stop_codon:yes gene_type:complete
MIVISNLSTDFKQKKTISKAEMVSFVLKSLAVSYSHMGRPHTTIGAERFHFRVRNGIGWFPLAKTTRQTSIAFSNLKISDIVCVAHIHVTCHITKVFWCYMAKPHEQLVLVSFIHY